VDAFWIIVGCALVIWAFYALLTPPKKHKDFSLRDQNEATHRALGGSRPPDAADVEPPVTVQKRT
jgi:hypothetical protein